MIQKQHKLFVTGIGTEVGKTIISAILVEAFKADYWKPIQAGLDEKTDTELVQELAPNHGHIFEEKYRLKAPMSPDASAAREGLKIELKNFNLPDTNNHIIVEGAGGLLVPLNNEETVLDLVHHLQLPVVLISRHYLGSINHTLLTIESLKRKNIKIDLLVFIGDHPETEASIIKHSGVKSYLKIPEVDLINQQFVRRHAIRFFCILNDV